MTVNRAIVLAANLALCAVLVFIFVVIGRSTYSPPPARLTDMKVTVLPRPDGVLITFVQSYEGQRTEALAFTRTMYQKDYPSAKVLMESGTVSTVEGAFKSAGAVFLPWAIKDTWCMETTATWWPPLSQLPFQMNLPTACFAAPHV